MKLKKISIIFIFVMLGLSVFFYPEKANAEVDFNCYCNDGSLKPLYYPILKKINTDNSDNCHQECANIRAKYFSFSTVSHLGVTNVTKGPASATQNPANSNPVAQVTDTRIPGTSVDASSGLIKCGRPGQNMCTLCDLIAGMNVIIQYLMKIAIGVALLAITIGGAMYIISAGDKNMIGKAKTTMENAAWGFVIIFAGYLIINTTITYLGAKTDANGNATFGMNITSWGQFDCSARNR